MSFDSFEQSLEGSQPFEIYKILVGSKEFFYTSGDDTVTVDGDDYEPTEIKRTAIAMGKQSRAKVVSVSVAAATELAQRYVGPPPGVRATISIFRLQRGEGTGDKALIYSGTIKAVTFPKNGQFAEMQCQSLEASTNRAVPRYTYMGMCNHLLYSTPCGVIQADFKHTGIVSTVSNNLITIVGLSASGLDVKGGFLDNATGTEKRQILAVAGDVVTVLLPFEVSPLGTQITAFAGCDRVLTSDCAVTFQNEERFGGFAFSPARNPFVSGLALLWSLPLIYMMFGELL